MSDEQLAHPGDDLLVDLALGELPADAAAATLLHVDACPACRTAYDAACRALDDTLAASPAIAPSAGFESRVLAGLGVRPTRTSWARHRAPLLAAAAAVGVLAGSLATATVLHDESPPARSPSASGWAAELRTPAGDTVGSVQTGSSGTRDVLVIQIEDGPAGMEYVCRLRLADGSTRAAGSWRVPASGDAVWVVPRPAALAGVEMVATGSGEVWSSAQVDG